MDVSVQAARVSFQGGSNSMVESQPSKLLVAGSIPVSRSRRFATRQGASGAGAIVSNAGVAQLVEHLICNQRVGGSNPSASSMFSAFPHAVLHRCLAPKLQFTGVPAVCPG